MTVTVKRYKRRTSETSETAELVRWAMVFTYGSDYFGELGMSDEAARSAAHESWQRLGTQFLAIHLADGPREVPWALASYGVPPCR